jgi:uronate dehydrogenase
VEDLVWTYHLLDRRDWSESDPVRLLDGADQRTRAVLVLRMANELEDHLDLARAHRDAPFQERIVDLGPGMVALARGLDLPVLAAELEATYAENLAELLPPAARWGRRRAYELGRSPNRRRVRRFVAGLRARGVARPEPASEPGAGPRPRILVTGAAGLIGRALAPALRERFALRLLDLHPVAALGDDEVVRGDIRDDQVMAAACEDVVAVVHLAARGHDAPIDELVAHNVEGTRTVFEAARRAGVGTIVFASTGQVVGGYAFDQPLTPDLPVRPTNPYACTKVYGEALARYYAEQHGLSVVCLRVGWFEREEGTKRQTRGDLSRTWCSPGDLAQLVVKSIEADVGFAVLFAVSDNEDRAWDLESARRTVGFEPRDRCPRPAATATTP